MSTAARTDSLSGTASAHPLSAVMGAPFGFAGNPPAPASDRAASSLNDASRLLYETKANTLIRAANGFTEDISYVATANHLADLHQKSQLAPASVRLYRSALRHVFAHHPLSDTAEALELLDRIAIQPRGRSLDSPVRTRRACSVTEDDFRAISAHLLSTSYHVDRRCRSGSLSAALLTAYWFGISIETGLRPVEWNEVILTEWTPERPTPAELLVRTAKTKTGESLRLRAIPIRDLKTHQAIRAFIAVHKSWIGFYLKKHGSLARANTEIIHVASMTLARASTKLWPNEPDRRYSLYSARHQSAANFRYLFQLEDAACILGHDLKSHAKYGTKAQPWTTPRVIT